MCTCFNNRVGEASFGLLLVSATSALRARRSLLVGSRVDGRGKRERWPDGEERVGRQMLLAQCAPRVHFEPVQAAVHPALLCAHINTHHTNKLAQ